MKKKKKRPPIKNRIESMYQMRVLQKMTANEIADIFKISSRTVRRAVHYFSKKNDLSKQTASELIHFYEHEIRMLLQRRAGIRFTQKSYSFASNAYIGITRVIIELQDKVAELCKLTGAKQSNIDQSIHKTSITLVIPKERLDRFGDHIKALAI